MFRGKWLKIISGEVVDGSTSQASGTVIGDKALEIACGDGSSGERSIYRMLEVQPEGKQAMAADAFLRGAQLKKGDLLAGEPV